MYIVMLREFKNDKNVTQRKFLVFMANVSLQTAKSEIGFQSFLPVTCYWEMNPDLDSHQTSIEIL